MEEAWHPGVDRADGCSNARGQVIQCVGGVAGRKSDNTMIQSVLGWEPTTPFRTGLAKTYAWIAEQYEDRKAGRRTVHDTI